MKKLMGLLLLSILFVFPLCANANNMGNVSLSLQASGPSGTATFPILGTLNVEFDYDVKLNNGALNEAFCVENAYSTSGSTNQYTLLSIDSSLSTYGLTPAKYETAAAIAQYYWLNYEGKGTAAEEDSWKASAQIAIWEVIFDNTLSSAVDLDLGGGTFKYSGTYSAHAQDIWDAVKSSIPTSSTEWALAVSPVISATNPTVTVASPQNYLVRNPEQVPEPASLLLFGLGLLGLAGVGRKMKK